MFLDIGFAVSGIPYLMCASNLFPELNYWHTLEASKTVQDRLRILYRASLFRLQSCRCRSGNAKFFSAPCLKYFKKGVITKITGTLSKLLKRCKASFWHRLRKRILASASHSSWHRFAFVLTSASQNNTDIGVALNKYDLREVPPYQWYFLTRP